MNTQVLLGLHNGVKKSKKEVEDENKQLVTKDFYRLSFDLMKDPFDKH